MRLHLRPSPPSSAPADRVRDLLAAGGGGWVPPPETAVGGLREGLALGAVLPLPHGPVVGAGEGGPGGEQRDFASTSDDEASGPRPDSSWQPRRADPAHADFARVDAPRSDPAGAGQRHADRVEAVRQSASPRTRVTPTWRAGAALVVVTLLAALVAGAVVLRGRPQEVAAPEVVESAVAPLETPATPAPAAGTGEVVVAVAGKVTRPGLVRLPAGSRVDDAVRAAGGALPDADIALLNLARKLVDGEQVLVGVDPPPGAPVAPAAGPAVTGLVDLNSATAADLDALPGIGPVLAERIVQWRSEHGPFASVQQLREVTGIGESKYSDLEGSVTAS